jgi:hypothetical protein
MRNYSRIAQLEGARTNAKATIPVGHAKHLVQGKGRDLIDLILSDHYRFS